MLRNPVCFERLRGEVDQHAAEKGGGYVTFKDSQGMPYLQAVIKEALRMHPATGLPLERVVPAGGATISGYFFQEGVSSLTISARHRS
ncbi:cytochrome P450 [Candidatus Bathyarchaeota archaeon]|nr:cytochrome P450 [Candidatus Bathyarchaeota archaeon]